MVLSFAIIFLAIFAFSPSFSEVVDIDPSNISKLHEGEWLFEIYAPWCGHCKRLEQTWTKLSLEIKGTKVARTNGEAFKDIAVRFLITGYPSIFHIKNGQVRAYPLENGREVNDFIKFARTGWKDHEPYGWYISPLGFPGFALSVIGKIASSVEDLSQVWTKQYEQPMWSFVVVGLVVVVFLTVVVTLVVGRVLSFVVAKKRSNTRKKKKKRNKQIG